MFMYFISYLIQKGSWALRRALRICRFFFSTRHTDVLPLNLTQGSCTTLRNVRKQYKWSDYAHQTLGTDWFELAEHQWKLIIIQEQKHSYSLKTGLISEQI